MRLSSILLGVFLLLSVYMSKCHPSNDEVTALPPVNQLEGMQQLCQGCRGMAQAWATIQALLQVHATSISAAPRSTEKTVLELKNILENEIGSFQKASELLQTTASRHVYYMLQLDIYTIEERLLHMRRIALQAFLEKFTSPPRKESTPFLMGTASGSMGFTVAPYVYDTEEKIRALYPNLSRIEHKKMMLRAIFIRLQKVQRKKEVLLQRLNNHPSTVLSTTIQQLPGGEKIIFQEIEQLVDRIAPHYTEPTRKPHVARQQMNPEKAIASYQKACIRLRNGSKN